MSELPKSGIQLKSISLVNVEFNIDIGSHLPVKDGYDIDLELDYGEKGENLYYSSVKISIHPKDSSDNFKLSVTMAGEFELQNEIQIDLEEFFSVNASAIIFPYVRQYIRNTTLEISQGSAIILPIINFVALFDHRKQSDQEA